ncbi:MAG: hypothetical protein MZW92_52960 [Comamonadaceae bacterium]|nr:hypothetical protein [Comamonadaceae bacterium]
MLGGSLLAAAYVVPRAALTPSPAADRRRRSVPPSWHGRRWRWRARARGRAAGFGVVAGCARVRCAVGAPAAGARWREALRHELSTRLLPLVHPAQLAACRAW